MGFQRTIQSSLLAVIMTIHFVCGQLIALGSQLQTSAPPAPAPVYDPYFRPTTYQQGVPPPTYQPATMVPPPVYSPGAVPPPVYSSMPPATAPQVVYPGTFSAPATYGTPQYAAPGTTLPPIANTAPPAVYTTPQMSVPGIAAPPMDPFAYNSTPYPFGIPATTSPQTMPPMATSPYGPSVYNPTVPPTLYPTNPLAPNAMMAQTTGPVVWWPNTERGWPELAWSRWRVETTPGCMQHTRFRQGWIIGGDDPADLQILESQLVTTLVWPSFLGAVMPLRISPGYDLHLWDGPNTEVTGFDLPAKAHSAYTTFDFISDVRRNGGFEANFTAGIYTDGENIGSNSWRFTGVGLAWFRLGPSNVLKLGAEYYDRIDLKMLPAFGFFLQPNNDLKIDLYFPRPRLAHRFPPRGNTEVWGYVSQEFGGASWSIQRVSGFDDQVDINDKRLLAGLEWKNPRGGTGFLEAGYVWDRHILYRSDPSNKLDNSDSFMIRTGFAF